MLSRSELHRISKAYELPEYVSQASLPSDLELSAMSDGAFADSDARRLPVHTKAAAVLSTAIFCDGMITRGQFDQSTCDQLAKAAQFWGVEDIASQIGSKAQQAVKEAAAQASNPDNYAMIFDGEFAGQSPQYPIHDAEAVAFSCKALYEQRHLWPLSLRKSAALRLIKRATELSCFPIDPSMVYMGKAAGITEVDGDSLCEMLMDRIVLLDRSPVVEKLAQIASHVRGRTVPAEEFAKCAELVDTLDRKTELYRRYGTSLDLPEEVEVPESLLKSAASRSTITLVNGAEFDGDEIERAGLGPFSLMPEFMDAVSTNGSFDLDKAADILPTLPRDEADIFVQAMGALVA
jgi:hypothetical protein